VIRQLETSDQLKLIIGMYFAQTALAAEADAVLEKYDLGRAHHRVLVFVGLRPGITASELLKLFRIRAQSLNPILTRLVRDGLVMQKTGDSDRRLRHLFLTQKGARIHESAARPQFERIAQAVEIAGESSLRGFYEVVLNLLDTADLQYMQEKWPPREAKRTA
jgi:DNA-binding MarR family transcriptional regulator